MYAQMSSSCFADRLKESWVLGIAKMPKSVRATRSLGSSWQTSSELDAAITRADVLVRLQCAHVSCWVLTAYIWQVLGWVAREGSGGMRV
jgi:hypothetical protein